MPQSENSKNIYIIDHDDDDRMLLHEALLTLDYQFQILEISSRGELIEYLSKLSDIFPELIFFNTSMLGIEGLQYIETVREKVGSDSKIKIIIYSTDSERSSIEKAFELGADFYAVKPSNYGDLKNLAQIIMEMDWETLKGDCRIFHIH